MRLAIWSMIALIVCSLFPFVTPDESASHHDEFVVCFETTTRVIDGREFRVIDLTDGAVTRHEGWSVPFISVPLELPGEIGSIDLTFGSPVKVRSDSYPWMVPTPDGSVVDPEWERGSDLVMRESYDLVDLGNGPSGHLYSIRVRPVRYGAGDDAWVFTSFSLSIPPPSRSDPKPTGPIKYLIITHTDLVDEVTPLAEWKSQKGLLARIVTTDEIDETYTGSDLVTKMRKYVMDLEASDNLDYLLLAGDWDKVPTLAAYNDNPMGMYGEPGYYATDGYFACVDPGTTWNPDGDSRVGEPNDIDDPIPDMAVGRLSISSVSLMEDIVADLIDRDKDLPFTTVEPVFMTGDPGQNPGYPIDTMDHYWDTYCSDIFSSRETMDYNGTGTLSFHRSSVKKVLDDRHQFLGYFSHGDTTNIPNLYDRSDVQSLSGNGHAGAFFAMACLTGWFDKPGSGMTYFTGDCLGEVLTETPDKGVVGYMGSSRLAVGDIDTIYSGDAPGLEEDYWRAVRAAMNGEINSTTGDIYRYAVTHFSSTFHPFPGGMYDGSLRTFLEYNLLGEPDAPLILEEPGQLRMTFDLAPEKTYVTATVTDGSQPVEGASVTVSRLHELGITTRTDQNGFVNITIPPSNGGNVSITAYRRGDRPAIEYFDLPDERAPSSRYTIQPGSPDGLNGYYITSPTLRIMGDESTNVEYNFTGTIVQVPQDTPIPIPHGEWNVNYRVIDLAGHPSEWSILPVKVDLVGPAIAISSDPPSPDGLGGYYLSEVEVGLDSDEEVYDAQYRIDMENWRTLDGNVALPQGRSDISFRCRDAAGNWNTTSGTYLVDSRPPVSSIAISHSPDGENGYYTSRPTFELRTQDANDPVLSYRWDGGPWVLYEGPMQPDDGVHLLEYKANDAPGNEETVRSQLFKVDVTDPSISVVIEPGSPDGREGFYVTRPVVGVEISEGELRYAILPPGIDVDWNGNSLAWTGPLTIKEGEWKLYLRCTDEAGRTVTRGPIEFEVDITPPSLQLSLWPEEPDGDNGFYITRPLARAETDADSQLFYRPLGSAEWAPYKSNMFVESAIDVKAIDKAGNEIVSSTPEFRFDPDAPWVHFVDVEYGQWLGPDTSFLQWMGGDNFEGYSFTVRIDAGPEQDHGNSTRINLVGIGDGAHTFNVMIRDLAGNTRSATMMVNLDRTAPTLLNRTPEGTGILTGTSIMVAFSEEMDPSTVTLQVEGVTGKFEWDLNRLYFRPSVPLKEGRTYTVTVTGSDILGNDMGTISWTFRTVEPVKEQEEDGSNLPIFVIAAGAILVIALVIILTVVLVIRKRQYDSWDYFE